MAASMPYMMAIPGGGQSPLPLAYPNYAAPGTSHDFAMPTAAMGELHPTMGIAMDDGVAAADDGKVGGTIG